MQAHLFTLKGQLFLDLFTTESPDIIPPPIPSHLVMKVEKLESALKFWPLQHDWLRTLLLKHPDKIDHLIVSDDNKPENGRVVLTAHTDQLQKFILTNLKTEGAWTDPVTLSHE
jgi:hypothetical protein